MAFAIRLFEKIRLFTPMGLLFQPGADHLPHEATVALPPCLLCNKKSKLPPSQTGWIQCDEPRLFMVCGDCGFDCDDAELERKIIERVSEPIPAE
jgi:hypothetical protein